jgi:N-methylhydantoinase A
MRHDLAQTFYRPLDGLDASAPADVFRELEAEGAELLREQGVAATNTYFARFADMRYVGQEYSVTVPIQNGGDLGAVSESFHGAHRVRYGHSTPGAPVEFVNLRVAAMGRIASDAVPFASPDSDADATLGTRTVIFDGRPHETTILHRDRLPAGYGAEGPLVIEEDGATTVVPPGRTLGVDEFGNLLIRTGEA